MRVLVCGGRHFMDYERVRTMLDEVGPSHIIHGGATGADTLAGRYAEENDIPCDVFPAHWSRFGAAAGPLRNTEMLTEGKPELVVFFPGSKGTMDMVNKARKAGCEVRKG